MCQMLTSIASIIVALLLHRANVIDAGAMWIIISISVFKIASMIDDILEIFTLEYSDDSHEE